MAMVDHQMYTVIKNRKKNLFVWKIFENKIMRVNVIKALTYLSFL